LNSTLSKVLVIGVGGAGNNLVSRFMDTGTSGVQCIAVNTDQDHLAAVRAHQKYLVGSEATHGLGACGDPEIGKRAVEQSLERFASMFWNVDTVFLVAGMGRGTGTGAAPILAQMARDTGAITAGLVTMPLESERRERMIAIQGLEAMSKACDTTVVIDNNRPVETMPGLVSESVLPMADNVLLNVLKGLSENVSISSYGFRQSNIRNLLKIGGVALAGIGESNSTFRVEEAVRNALQSPFLEVDRGAANGALVFVSGDSSMSNSEAARVAEVVGEMLPVGASLVWGARVDPSLDSSLRVTLVLTGMDYWQQYVGGYRKMPFGIYNMEPEVGKDKSLDIDLDLDQLESD
jgi:cell division protein FtsZ